jgi:tRNA(fMet)-specific endonuclease VapC
VSLQYLLDTNIISEPLKPKPNSSVSEKLQRHRTKTAIATPVWHELWFGCNRLPNSRRRDAMEYYLLQVVRKTIPFLDYDVDSATWHAQERARLVALGQTPPFLDGQIAAIAKANHLILVTGNVSDYQNFTGLQVENWYDNSNG